MNHKELFGCQLRVEESRGRRGGKGGKGGGGGGDRYGDRGGDRGGDPYGGDRYGDRGGGGPEMKPGDWNCSKCSAMNFARRSECFRCFAPGVSFSSLLFRFYTLNLNLIVFMSSKLGSSFFCHPNALA